MEKLKEWLDFLLDVPSKAKPVMYAVLIFLVLELLYYGTKAIIHLVRNRYKRRFYRSYTTGIRKQDKTIHTNYKKGITKAKKTKGIYKKTR